MTILGPILMAAVVVIPVYIATQTNEVKTVAVLDETGMFNGKFTDSDDLKFHYLATDLVNAKKELTQSSDHALLFIPKPDIALPTNALIYSEKSVSINLISHVRNVMSHELEQQKLQIKLQDFQKEKKEPVNVDELLRSIKTSVDINTVKIESNGTESKSYTEINMVIGFFFGFLIYMFIFMYGSQVMRGVIEEKTSRIVEVIVSSVKPFQLMMGKIIGVGMVGLTQFLLWVILTFSLVTTVMTTMNLSKSQVGSTREIISQQGMASIPVNSEQKKEQNEITGGIMEAVTSVDYPSMIGSFIFFFIFGYLMYASLFAAVGGAVDSEADTQQFIVPITLPLILSIMMIQFIIQDPDGPVAFWMSLFPLTSPVVMMIRIPFTVQWWEVALSMVLLILGFIGSTWMAGKIYRTGILMYGKKVTYKELWKWIRY